MKLFNRFFLLINAFLSVLFFIITFYFSNHFWFALVTGILISVTLAFFNLVLQLKGFQELYDISIKNLRQKFEELSLKHETEFQKQSSSKKKNILLINCASCHKTNKVPVPYLSSLTDLIFECSFCKTKNKVFSYFQTAVVTEPIEESNIYQKLEKELYQNPLQSEIEIISAQNSNLSSSTNENKTKK